MNGTLSIEDRAVAEARRFAAIRGTSLNQLVRDFLRYLTRVDDVKSTVAQLDALWAEETIARRVRGRTRNCMSGCEFLDTNVLIYAHDARHPRKRTCARELIRCLLRDRRSYPRTEAP